jgi:glycerol-3-phosphate dehydrogenase (NAD(P)+)
MARAVARILAYAKMDVRVWARRRDAIDALMKDVSGLTLTREIAEAVEGASVIFFAVPASALPSVAAKYGDSAKPDHVVIHAVRGVGNGFKLPHQVLRETTCVRKIGVLGGPLQAVELTSGRPLAAVLASKFSETVRAIQALTKNTPVIVHGSKDVVGVEVAGALSNVAAIAGGMSDKLELGETARGLLLTRGLVEARLLGVALGADSATFAGLAGVGDLIPRKVTSTDRHRQLGTRLAEGVRLEAALAVISGEVEGVLTAREAIALATRLSIDLPLVRAVESVLDGKATARDALESVLRLDLDLETKSPAAAPA